MDYFIVLFGFASALVALFGDTWRPMEAGLARLTHLGKGALVFVVLSAALNSYNLYAIKADQSRVDSIVSYEVSAALNALEAPLKLLYMDIKRQYVENVEMDNLLDPSILKEVQATCFLEYPKVITFSYPPMGTWGDIFAEDIKRGMNILASAVSAYATYIDAKTLKAMHEVLSSDFRRYAKFERGHFSRVSKETSDFPKCLGQHADNTFKKYIDSLTSLRKVTGI